MTAVGLAGISTTSPLDVVLRQVAQVAAAVVPAPAYSVAFVRDGQARAMEFTTSAAASGLDERKRRRDYGPALAAALTGQRQVVDTGSVDGPHPDFRRAAQEQGVRQVVSFPLALPAVDGAAALTLYAHEMRRPGALSDVARIAETISCSVGDAVRHHDAVFRAQQFEEAMLSRATIEQAKGMIMANLGCDANTAFEVLKRVSSHTNSKLRDVAVAVLARRVTPQLRPPEGS